MARRPSKAEAPQRVVLSKAEKRSAITKLRRRVDELRQLSVATITIGDDPAVKRLEMAVENAIGQIWPPGSHEYSRLSRAWDLDRTSHTMKFDPLGRGGGGTPIQEIREGVDRGRQQAIAMLEQAANSLEEELRDEEGDGDAAPPSSAPSAAPASSGGIVISPTIYVQGPNAQIQVGQRNSVSVDRGAGFADFEQKMAQLLGALRDTNDLSPEAKDQVAGELRAGMELIKTPKPDKSALQTYLLRPLQWLTKEYFSGTVRAAAGAAFVALTKIAVALLGG
jgi:hypothetical protein